MKSFVSRASILFLAVAIFATLVPLSAAQTVSSFTQVSTVPAGLAFMIDGQGFVQNTAVNWPTGSKHTLYAPPTQLSEDGGIQYTFVNWVWAGGALPGGTDVIVTADPSISSYQAIYEISYGVHIIFSSCPVGTCMSPGTVYVNGVPFIHDATVYVAVGGSVVLQAVPANGFVFGGWGSINSTAVIQGFQQTIVVNQPVTLYPLFQMARTINLASVPSLLQVLADRTPVTTPSALQWGIGSTHTVGPVSPQQDVQGQFWVFGSWNDGGAPTHSYTVASISNPDTLTATYVPAALAGFATMPQGLSLNVDGRTNWPTYNFVWGVGETHTVSAPAQQTDAQGHIWNFSKWSNGGAQTQTIAVPASAVANSIQMTATYTQSAQLTVNAAIGGLAVTVNGAPCALPCTVVQPLGTQVDVGVPLSLPVGPGSRQSFLSWSISGAAATGTAANGDLLLTLGPDNATAAPVYHLMNSLTASSLPAGGATVGMQPPSPDGYYDSQASVTVTATALPGYRFRAWNGDLSSLAATGVLTMSVPRAVTALLDMVPTILPSGIVNGAGATPQAVLAPGSVVSVFGVDLAPTTAAGPSSPMAQSLGGVTARVGAQMIPLFFVSPGQVNLQLPPGLPPGPQTLTISSPGQPDAQGVFQVAADAPGVFSSSVVNGVTFGLAIHADGSLVTSAAPAKAGETLALFGTGFGSTVPTRPEGFAVPLSPLYLLTDPVTVQVGGISSPPVNAYAWPGAAGVNIIQFAVPSGLASATNAALTVTINGIVSNTVQLPIQ